MEQRPIPVLHDPVPSVSPVRAALRRLPGEAMVIDLGTRLRLLDNPSLARAARGNKSARMLIVRNAQLVRVPSRLRSIATLCHPVLLAVRALEARAVADERAASGQAAPQAVAARLARLVAEQPGAYPGANVQTGQYAAAGSEQARPRAPDREAARLLAERLCAEGIDVLFGDFPEALATGLGAAGEIAQMGWTRARLDAAAGAAGQGVGVVAALAAWRERLPSPLFRDLCAANEADLVLLDAMFAARAASLGLAPANVADIDAALGEAAELTGHRRPRAARLRPFSASRLQAAPATNAWVPDEALIEPDPVLGWRNRAGVRARMPARAGAESGAEMSIDAEGCRTVPGQPGLGDGTIAVYGGSTAFGVGVGDAETFAARLQAMRPRWRVENRAVPGHGTGHNLLALRRDARWAAAEWTVFVWTPRDRAIAVADPNWIAAHVGPPLRPEWSGAPIEMTPRAMLDSEGGLDFRPIRLPRTDFAGIDFADFRRDDCHSDLIALRLLQEAAGLARASGHRFLLLVAEDALSATLARGCAAAGINVLQAAPAEHEMADNGDGVHPDAAGHASIAARLAGYLDGQTGERAEMAALDPDLAPSLVS